MANLILPGGERVDIPRRLWFPSAMTIVSLFLGGLYLGKVISDTPNAVGAYLTTQTIHGKVVKVHGKPVRVLVPARTIVSQGTVVTLPPSTVDLVKNQSTTIVHTVHGTRYVTRTEVVPTTITTTTATTIPTTVIETATVTETVTVTDSGTTTVTTTAATS